MKHTGGIKTDVGSGNNDILITLGVNQVVQDVSVAVPGALGNIAYQVFDGPASSGKAIHNKVYLAANPKVNQLNYKLTDATGRVGIRITGWTSGSTNAMVNVAHQV